MNVTKFTEEHPKFQKNYIQILIFLTQSPIIFYTNSNILKKTKFVTIFLSLDFFTNLKYFFIKKLH